MPETEADPLHTTIKGKFLLQSDDESDLFHKVIVSTSRLTEERPCCRGLDSRGPKLFGALAASAFDIGTVAHSRLDCTADWRAN